MVTQRIARARWANLVPLGLILITRITLSLAYGQTVPIWEADNEDGHFAYARYLAVNQTLVLRPGDPEADAIWEKFQPPLYYILIAPIVAPFDLGATFEPPERNPYLAAGNAGVNYALHPVTPSAAQQELIRAVRTARAAGSALSTLSVIGVYVAAHHVFGRDRRAILTAACLYAFWPQYLFFGSMVNNDVLVTALSAAALALAAGLVAHGFDLRRTLLLAGLTGMALFAKLTAVGLAPMALAAVGMSLLPTGRRAPPWQPISVALASLGLAGLLVGTLWLLSQMEFVTAQVFQAATVRELVRYLGPDSTGTVSLVTTALAYAFRTFLASFGWGNVEIFSWAYPLWGVGAGVSVAGLAWGLWQRRLTAIAWRQLSLMALYVASLLVLSLGLVVAYQSIHLVPGRYLMPALPAVVILLVSGWRELAPTGPVGCRSARLVAAGAVLLGWAIPIWTLLPAYARPPAVSADEAGAGLPLHVRFGEGIELISMRERPRTAPGEAVRPELCWQSTALIAANYTLSLEVVGADGQGYGRLVTYPGRGNYPTSAWVVAEPFCESYEIDLGATIPAPALAYLRVAWRDDASGAWLRATTASGERLANDEARLDIKVRARPGPLPAMEHTVAFGFGGSAQYPNLRLTGYTVEQHGAQVAVTLRWEAVTTIPGDYSVFVHLRDTPETFYAAADSQPLNGTYPTRLWEPGEVIVDTHWVTLPAGPAPPLDLYVGLRNPAEDARVAAFDAGGARLTHDEVVLEQGLRLAAP